MLRLDEIRDPEVLRQVAVLLERENAKLHAKVQSLIAELAQLRGAAAVTAQRELEFLKELLAQRERELVQCVVGAAVLRQNLIRLG